MTTLCMSMSSPTSLFLPCSPSSTTPWSVVLKERPPARHATSDAQHRYPGSKCHCRAVPPSSASCVTYQSMHKFVIYSAVLVLPSTIAVNLREDLPLSNIHTWQFSWSLALKMTRISSITRMMRTMSMLSHAALGNPHRRCIQVSGRHSSLALSTSLTRIPCHWAARTRGSTTYPPLVQTTS